MLSLIRKCQTQVKFPKGPQVKFPKGHQVKFPNNRKRLWKIPSYVYNDDALSNKW